MEEQGDDGSHVEASIVALGASGGGVFALVVGTIWKTTQVLGIGMREMPMFPMYLTTGQRGMLRGRHTGHPGMELPDSGGCFEVVLPDIQGWTTGQRGIFTISKYCHHWVSVVLNHKNQNRRTSTTGGRGCCCSDF
jgi:hypothetical protein